MSDKVTLTVELMDTECRELKVMYALAQIMDYGADMDEEERRRVVEWFSSRYSVTDTTGGEE